MKRKLMALLIVVIMLCTMTLPVSAALNADTRNSVVVVKTSADTSIGTLGLSTGTGFFINDQYLITNHHVVEAFLYFGAGEEVDYIPTNLGNVTGRLRVSIYYDSGDAQDAFVVGYDEHKDVAILRIDKPTDKRVPLQLLVPTEDMVGSEVYAVGYPGIADDAANAIASWGKSDATVTSGSISRLITQAGTGRQAINIDCSIKEGNSGGPLVTADGHAVGIVTWYVSQAQINDAGITTSLKEQSYAVNISEAIALLNQYGISYTLAPKPIDDLFIILAGAGALLVIIILVIVIISMKKKSNQPAPAPIPVQPAARPIVRSHSRVNYGVTANVGSQPILIGRSSNCALRFPSNAPGVSGSHCSVQYNAAAREFIVTDMNSTYGTFLMSGQKLTPNQPCRMRAGERFYLAEQTNTIELSLE